MRFAYLAFRPEGEEMKKRDEESKRNIELRRKIQNRPRRNRKTFK
jgi:hypothetical protein